ncbi:MAG: glycoside hydrolase family 6 protein [Actinomycetota bacterium]|nr:glycoside hydrolase family 6 protein [Actinomycetota bacterium]
MALPASAGQVFSDGAASGGEGLLIWSNGTAAASTSTTSASAWLAVRARGDQCEGAPQLRIAVNGMGGTTLAVSSSGWADYVVPVDPAPGAKRIEATFLNDHATPWCDRNVRLDSLVFRPAAVSVEAEAVPVTTGSGQAVDERTASGGSELLLWSNGTARARLAAPAGGQLVVRARGDICAEPPRMRVTVAGKQVLDAPVTATTWTDVPVPGAWPGGTQNVDVALTNDWAGNGCDRNLRLDVLKLVPAPAPAPAPAPTPSDNPFLGTRGYVDPNSPARLDADRRRAWDPAGAAALDKVASGPQADWFGDWVPTSSLARVVGERVSTQTAAGALPVVVTYAIPHRDCGNYSAGGLGTATEYGAWIRQLAAGIGSRKAVVVLEPDGLALTDCLTPTARQERYGMLADAVDVLEALPATTVYLDAGGAGWHSTEEMAGRLKAAGVGKARGFSINVSNFADDATNLRYGNELSARLGGEYFIADTSRNGLGSGSTWCNPEGRALGRRFTAATGSPFADAFTWIKRPGESDGTCGGGPAAGQWWSEYAIGLGQRASW